MRGKWRCALWGMGSIAVATLAGCVPPPIVAQPMSARPQPLPPAPPADGAIYHAGHSERPLFEDLRARNVGDTLVIVIAEKTAADKKSSSSAERTGAVDFSVPVVKGLPGKTFQDAKLSAKSSNKFDGKGEGSAENNFTGTIAVTVTEVLPNGNLVVSGEKQIAMQQGTEFIRFSGVVKPTSIVGNAVASAQVADARIEYRQNGYIDEAQVMGWLARFFFTFLPF